MPARDSHHQVRSSVLEWSSSLGRWRPPPDQPDYHGHQLSVAHGGFSFIVLTYATSRWPSRESDVERGGLKFESWKTGEKEGRFKFGR